MTPSFERGSLFLDGGRPEALFRLVWSGDRKPISVPKGTYRIRNFKIERERAGEAWMLSGSDPKGATIEVKEGADTAVAIDERVTVRLGVKRRDRKLHLQLAVVGHAGMGLTLARGEGRPQPAWQLRRGDRELSQGAFAFA